jgi:NAD(P)-dependent dehydrogenase (short-subunit alcohol dehydrogenase family)
VTNHQEAQSNPTISSDPRLANKVVLVTGAAQGIGLAIVRKFLVEGAFVALNDLSTANVRTGLNQLRAFEEARVMGCPADVTDSAQCQDMIDQIVAHWGRIDMAVNNAGIYPSHPVLEMTEDDWDRVMDTNVKGMFLISQAVARQMVAQGIQGQIINISSGSYHRGRVGSAHYCASKAAGVMFTRVLAMELAPYGIRVNAVAPGLIDTGLLEVDEAYIESTLRQIPAGRLGRPEDVAEAVVSMAAMGTDYVTGAVLSVDGGLALGRYGIPVA